MMTALDEHLWTGGSAAPAEWLELRLWRDVYHCTPLELERIIARFGLRRVMTDLAMINLEQVNAQAKREAKRGGSGH